MGDAEESGRVKLAVMKLLYDKYGITEDDFTSAELEAVPAVKATDIGLDRSMIGAYGHDDRVCAYAALRALLDLDDYDGVVVVSSLTFDADGLLFEYTQSRHQPAYFCFEDTATRRRQSQSQGEG